MRRDRHNHPIHKDTRTWEPLITPIAQSENIHPRSLDPINLTTMAHNEAPNHRLDRLHLGLCIGPSSSPPFNPCSTTCTLLSLCSDLALAFALTSLSLIVRNLFRLTTPYTMHHADAVSQPNPPSSPQIHGGLLSSAEIDDV
eukprot:scaffold171838_cov56-Cyclotella_meneghiniana.AAC.1